MAKDTRSSRKIKDNGNNTSKKRLVNVKGSSTSGSATTDTSGLRRSSRETSSRKQMISGPSSTRKSERLEKRMLNTPLKKKSEKTEKQRIPSPLRRSDRSKKHPSSSSSGSKKSEKGSASSDMKLKKLKRVKNVKQLTLAAREVSRNEKQDLKPVSLKKKRMNAYKALFKPQRIRITLQDTDGELEKPDKLSQIGSSIVRGSASKQVEDGSDECSERMEVELTKDYVERTCEGAPERTNFSLKNFDTETSGDHYEVELSCSNQKHSCTEEPCEPSDGDGLNAPKSDGTGKQTLDGAQRIQVDCSATKKLQTPVLVGSTLIGRSLDCNINLGTDAISSPSSGCKRHNFEETCVACSKRRRVEYDLPKQDLCSCNTTLNKDLCENSVPKSRKESSIKLSKLPVEISPGLDYNHLNSINKLREYWYKGQHAVVIDDQERIMKVILFVLSLLPDVCQPFLIISTSNALSLWEAEFLRLAPSINVVVYKGNEDTRRSIRMTEFYEKEGRKMLQILLSTSDAVVEDLKMLECLRWEAIIVDECQNSRIFTYSDQIKVLVTKVRVLLFNGEMKDSIAQHLNLLSLLDSLCDLDTSDGSKTDFNDNLAKLKERLSRFIAYDCKSDSSRFVEYWIPVQISNVQLEQYCATLRSNSLTLCSISKNDPVGALRDILISTRKCCDHPYIVDQSLQGLITKDLPEVEYLDVGIKASGKLQLLDMMLSEMKNRQLRVVVLFQSIGGSGRDSIGVGDILDDFLRQRFGPDSYERVDVGVPPSKKQAALNKFNKDSGRFVFLLENRACLPSIKLSSVDTIVIFDSDWNPANDLRVLHKISIDSQSEHIKIFRLYSSFTVEEKLLILEKHNLTVYSNVQSISQSTTHMLLMWGASYLFDRLDEFHGGNTQASRANISYDQSLLEDVVKDFSALLSQNTENNDTTHTSNSIIKVRQRGGTYSRNISLLGQQQRNRKRVQYFDQSPKKSEAETSEVGKKRKKVLSDSIDPTSLKAGLEEGDVAGDKGGASGVPSSNGSQSLTSSTACVTEKVSTNNASTLPSSSGNISLVPEIHMVQSKERILREVQKSLHHLLKLEISKLCEILQLSEDVKVMVGRFLDYVIDNHHVSREPLTILQAFQISVCWVGASLLKHKIDRKKSLALAKQHLNFGCKEEEANNVYSKLRLLRKMFLYRMENLKESYSLKDSVSAAEDITKEMLDASVSQLVASIQQNVKQEVEEGSHNQEFAYEHFLSQQVQTPKYKMEEKEISKSIEQTKKKCEKGMTKLIRKQQEEIREFYRIWEKEKVQLEKEHWLESDIVCKIHSSNIPVRIEKLNILNNDFAKKLEEHKRTKDIRLKDLGAKQLAERNEKRLKAARWLAEVKSMVQGEVLGELSSHGSDFRDMVGHSQASEHTDLSDPGNIASVSGRPREERSPDGDLNGMQASGVAPSDVSKTAPNEAVGCSVPIESLTLPLNRNCENAVDAIASERMLDAGFEQPNGCYYQSLQDEGSQISISTGTRGGDGLASGNENIIQQLEVPTSRTVGAGPTNRTNFGAPIIEPVEQLLPSPSINLPLGHNQADLLLVHEVDHQPRSESHTSFQNADATDLPFGLNQPDLSSASGVDHQPNIEGCTSFQNTEVQPQLVEDTAELPNQAVLQPGGSSGLHPLIDIPIGGSGTHLPMHAAPQVASLMPGLPFYADPLQNELDRLRKEMEQADKVHEELKLQLRSECEKEIEEIIAQIRRKSEAKLQDVEAAFLLKRVELDANHNKVLMNKILAEAFKSVCPADLRPSGAFGMQQVVPSSFMHQLRQLSSPPVPRPPSPVTGSSSVGPPAATQQTALPPIQVVHHSSSHPVPRPSPVIGSSSIGSPAATHQTAVPPIQVVHHSSSHPVPRPSPVTGSSSVGPPAATHQTAVPPIQVAHHSLALFSSTPTRPPHISPITPPTGNPPVIREVRAPAPHIQPFRPSTSSSTNIPSLPHGMLSHQAPSIMPTTSPPVPQLPPKPPPLLPPPPLTYYSGSCIRPPCPEIAGGFPTLQNLSSSALELLMDVDNRPGAHTPNLVPPRLDLDSNFNSLDSSELRTMGSVEINLAHSSVATDVVCLSDDD
ncbi:hypothetical protein F0562_021744 [Nyssa sinensis]|uniref:Helicase C-terminal domain-containing protein n=1 Tax=Nyssa sinensis TaxID=561372 RepID=A0A5J5BMH9_9ASTE|nr:hypothetical protein F0562_021744 [Nyssa sinensis]